MSTRGDERVMVKWRIPLALNRAGRIESIGVPVRDETVDCRALAIGIYTAH